MRFVGKISDKDFSSASPYGREVCLTNIISLK